MENIKSLDILFILKLYIIGWEKGYKSFKCLIYILFCFIAEREKRRIKKADAGL